MAVRWSNDIIQQSFKSNTVLLSCDFPCSKKPCKYFNQGKGECPFNNKCFYLHAYPDGRIASPRPWHRRQRQDADGETSIIGRILLSDFLDEFQENRRRRPGATQDEADEWETFFMRLQMLGIALPADDDDDDDDIDSISSSSSYSSSEDSDVMPDLDLAPVWNLKGRTYCKNWQRYK